MNPFPLTLSKNCNENMKTFRIVSELVDIEEYKDRPVSTVERYRIEQQYHFMGIFHFWKTPKFAANCFFTLISLNTLFGLITPMRLYFDER